MSCAQEAFSLHDLLVVDAGTGMAAALVAKLLADFGARVVRVEPAGGDPFEAIYPACSSWHGKAERVDAAQASALLAQADVCLTGGEDLPGLTHPFDAEALGTRYPGLVIVDFGGRRDGVASRPSVDLLAQARTGLVHEQLSTRPICFAMPLPTYGSALLGLIGLWATLLRRLRTGQGDRVISTLDQGVGLFWTPFWMEADTPDTAFATITPKDCRHLIFECADGAHLQLVLGTPGAVSKLYAALQIDVPVDPNDRGVPKPGAPVDQYFGNLDLIAAHTRRFTRSDALARLRHAGIAAEPVLQPGECWREPQVVACGLIETDHTGRQSVRRPFELIPANESQDHKPQARAACNPSSLPLAGLRIIDLGNFVAGPFASRLLGDLGADVIKVESPSGSATISGARTVYSSNCNKRSICIDLKSPEGLSVLADLCRTADAVHHNFRVGVAERLGVSPPQLRRFNPRLVTLQTTAYGHVGPKRHEPGFDMVMQALCGHEARAGGQGNPALWIRSPLVDYASGALGAIAMLMALYQRERHGTAIDATLSLLSTSLFLQSELTWTPQNGFAGAPLLNTEMTGFHPAESLYQTANGWIALALRDDAMAERFCKSVGLAGLPNDRTTWDGQTQAQIAHALRPWRREDLLQRLSAHDVWAEACVENAWDTWFETALGPLGQRSTVVEDARYGRVRGLVGTLLTFEHSHPGASHLRGAPDLGQHTREVLTALGYDDRKIDSLIKRQVCSEGRAPHPSTS